MVQVLCTINQIALPIHSEMPNPYSVLSSIPWSTSHYSVLNLFYVILFYFVLFFILFYFDFEAESRYAVQAGLERIYIPDWP